MGLQAATVERGVERRGVSGPAPRAIDKPRNKAGRACMRQARPEYVTRNFWGAPGGGGARQGRVGFRPQEGEEQPETLRPPAEGGKAGRT
jgi:hypothetical protein